MRRELGQLSLADGLVDGGAGRDRQLERIVALVDWAAFARLLVPVGLRLGCLSLRPHRPWAGGARAGDLPDASIYS